MMDDEDFEEIMDDFFGSGDGVAHSEGSLFVPLMDERGQISEDMEIPFQGGFINRELADVRFPQEGKKDLVLTTPRYERLICPNCNAGMSTEKKVIKAIFEEVLKSKQPQQTTKQGAKNMASPRVNHKENKDMKNSVNSTPQPEVDVSEQGDTPEEQRNAVISFMVGLSATLDSFETRYSLGEVIGEDNELLTQFFTLTIDVMNNLLFIAFNNSELSQDDSMFIADVSITLAKYCFKSGWSLKLVESYYTEEFEEEVEENE